MSDKVLTCDSCVSILVFQDRPLDLSGQPRTENNQVNCYAGFHTFDYARHFLSCCTRMLGLEHVTSRGSLMLEYYGRNVGVKIMPTGVKPERFLSGFSWNDTIWRRGELLSDVRPLFIACVSSYHQLCSAH